MFVVCPLRIMLTLQITIGNFTELSLKLVLRLILGLICKVYNTFCFGSACYVNNLQAGERKKAPEGGGIGESSPKIISDL